MTNYTPEDIQILHEGYCHTEGCSNYGYVYDAPSLGGVVCSIICGVCFVDFRDFCVLKN